MAIDDRTRVAALIEALADESRLPDIQALLTITTTDPWLARRQILEALVVARETAVPLLLVELGSHSSRIPILAAEALGRIGDPRAVEPLLDLLRVLLGTEDNHRTDADDDLMDAVIDALGELGDRRAIPLLIQKLEHEWSGDLGAPAARALIKFGDRAVPLLVDALANPRARNEVPYLLGQIGDRRAVGVLIERLSDPDDYMLREVIGALGTLGDRQAIPALHPLLDDPRRRIRVAAATSLVSLGYMPALSVLIEILPEHQWHEFTGAAYVCGEYGDARVIEPLLDALCWANREAQAALLTDSALRDKAASFAFLEVMRVAARALGKVGDRRALPELRWLQACEPLHHVDPDLSRTAAEAIERIQSRMLG